MIAVHGIWFLVETEARTQGALRFLIPSQLKAPHGGLSCVKGNMLFHVIFPFPVGPHHPFLNNSVIEI